MRRSNMQLRRAKSVSSIYRRDVEEHVEETDAETKKEAQVNNDNSSTVDEIIKMTMQIYQEKLDQLTEEILNLKEKYIKSEQKHKKQIRLLKTKISKHEQKTSKQIQTQSKTFNKHLGGLRNVVESIAPPPPVSQKVIYDSPEINVTLAQVQQDMQNALSVEGSRLIRQQKSAQPAQAKAQPILPPPSPTLPPPSSPPPTETTLSTNTPPRPTTAATPSPPTNQMTVTKSKTLIMTDSTCRNLRTNNLNTLINREREQIIVSKHPGATADQIHSYLDWWFTHEKPQTLVVAAGANDLLYEDREARSRKEHLANEPQVVSKLMDIGREARDRGVSNIYFSGLYTIKNLFDGYTSRFNQLLESQCQEHGFYFISNANIELDDLFDGLHVNNHMGHKKLKHNILKMCAKTYVHRNVKNVDLIQYNY